MEQEKIIQYITGNIADEAEKTKICNWINASAANKTEYIQLKNIYALSRKSNHKFDLDREYLKLRMELGIPTKRIFLEFIKYAAIVIFAVGLTVFFQRNYINSRQSEVGLMNEVISPAGQISELVLSDGTKVWLNAGSSISYPPYFSSQNRIVHLNGEAFFKVTKDKENPFVVETKKMKVKVLGTSFNIDAFDQNKFVETTLVEGKVELHNNGGAKIAEMFPGQLAKYDVDSRQVLISEVDTRFYSSWKDGKITFFNEPLEAIIIKLERWYNVKFTFSSEEIKSYRFSGTILKYKPLDQVLQIIKISSPINYQIIVNFEDRNEIVLTKLN